MDLQGVVGDLQGDVRGIHLCHGGLHPIGDMGLLLLGSGVDQEAGTAQLGGHIRQFEGDPLLEAHGLAELDPLLGIGQSVLVGPLGNPQGLGGHADAAAVQGGHGDLKALALLPQQVLCRHLHIVEDQLCGGGGADAHLVVVVPKVEPLPPFLHDEGADAPGADVRGGHGKDHVGVRLGSVGDEDLAPVEDVVVPFPHGGGLCPAGVGPGVGLGEAEGADLLPLGQGDQVFLLLRLGAKSEDGPGTQGHMGRQDDPRPAVNPGQFLHGDGIAENVQAGAAVLLGIGDAHEAHLPQLTDRILRELVLLVQQEGDGFDLLLRKGANLGTQGLVLRCGLE